MRLNIRSSIEYEENLALRASCGLVPAINRNLRSIAVAQHRSK